MAQDKTVGIRMTAEDLGVLDLAASSAKTTASDYIRTAALDRARGHSVTLSERDLAVVDEAIRRAEILGPDEGIPPAVRSAHVQAWARTAAEAVGHETTLGTITGRYAEVCHRSRPRLTPPEWRLVLGSLGGGLGPLVDGADLSDRVTSIPWEVADALRISADGPLGWQGTAAHEQGLTEAGVDALLGRLRTMRYDELVAVAAVAERWWAAGASSAVPGEQGWTEGS